MLFRICCFLMVFGLHSFLFAQEKEWQNSNYRTENLTATDTLQLEAKVILPEKFKITEESGIPVPASDYSVDYAAGIIIFNQKWVGKNLEISYFIHPDLQQTDLFAKDTSFIMKENKPVDLYAFEDENDFRNPEKELFSGLNSRGSLVRGIRFGNNQSASTQSSLDLQLSGNLSPDITVNAAISDNNVPIEADGYSQQLQEFDKVYVELAAKKSKVRAGHVDLMQENDYFGNFSQKVTGIQLSTLLEGEKSQTFIHASGSVSRGEFRIIRFNGADGNQGPYQLSGNNNEIYVIVLSGSEKIYIDGILLTRGETNDYVINYNTGELTFTSNRQITANSRITAEYLYTNRSYSQFMAYAGIEHISEKFNISGHFYSNGDSKNNEINSNLSDEDKQVLAAAGNDPNLMYAPTAEPAEYSPDRVLYRKVTVGGVEYFEYSTNPEDELFYVTFSSMGSNNGDYIMINLEQNGRVFEYVPPVNGVKQGTHDPVRQLVPPKRLQLYTLNSSYKLKNNGLIGADFGLSNQDLNLFSSIDDGKNYGLAGRVYGQYEYRKNQWVFTPKAELSYIQESFNAIQRIRSVEFARDFNLPTELEDANQLYAQMSLLAKFKENLNMNYSFIFLNNEDSYKGSKHILSGTYQTEKTTANTQASLLKTDATLQESNYYRYDVNARRRIGKTWWVGGQYWGESNLITDKDSMNYSAQSFRWDEFRVMSGIGDSASINLELTYYNRRDDSARLGDMQRMSNANGLILNSMLINKNNHQLQTSLHYRSVKYVYNDSSDEDFITGNIRWFKTFLNNGLTVNAFYELGSGVEAQREFEYVRVADGMGIYKWTDYNGDGIEQLDEFEIAEFSDLANYIRVYTSTVNYIRINKNAFNFSVRLKPKEAFNSESEFLERWVINTSLQTNNSFLKENKTLEWNPFKDTSEAMSSNQSIKATLGFNQGAKYKWRMAYTYSQLKNKQYVYTGSEYRDMYGHLVSGKYNFNGQFSLGAEIEKNTIESDSEIFSTRRYTLDNWRLAPKANYQIGKNFIASLTYTYQSKKNVLGIENLDQSNLALDVQWNDLTKSNLTAMFSFVKNNFEGQQESVVGNQMMEGLRAGQNYVWQLLFQRQLSSSLNLNIIYDGRQTENNKAIHTGSVQIQARF